MTRIDSEARPAPAGVILEDYLEDEEVGLLKSGKEADVYVVRRVARDRSCLLAAKRYRPWEERAFKNDIAYRAHRRLDGTVRLGATKGKPKGGRSLQLAMDKKTRYGRKAIHQQWVSTEWSVLRTLWEAGAAVPYPVAPIEDGVLMQFLGSEDGAAPRLAEARPAASSLPSLFDQARALLRTIVSAGFVHGDLSPYNVLLWDETLYAIDLPQAMPFLENLEATDFLHRDCVNLFSWFARKGLDVDPEDVFVEMVDEMFRYSMEDTFLSKGR